MKILAVKQELCTGCGECERICAMTFFKVPERDKSAIRVDQRSAGGYQVAFCNQCGECIAVCPTDALYRIKNGIVRLRAKDCVGCLACIGFCPDLVMYPVADDLVPIKCIACAKCVDVCPTGALYMTEVDAPSVVTEMTRSIRAQTGAISHGH
jgi:anaerobic carbon-monoxide dehydrogenase iron sulfur subunit